MKKLIYGSLFLATVGISAVGCKKQIIENNENSNTNNVKLNSEVRNEMLVFKTVEEFDELISRAGEEEINQIIALPFISYWETIDNDTLNVLNDFFMAAVLNKDFLIQIGNYIYKINKPNEKVFALHINKIEFLNDLINENTGNVNVLVFSVDDDVFDLLSEYDENLSASVKSSNKCAKSNQKNNNGWHKYADYTDVNNVYGNGSNKNYKFSVFYKVRYDNWGINRKLFILFKHKAQGGTWDATFFTPAYEYSYLAKNGNSGSNTIYPNYNFIENPTTTLTSIYAYNDKNKEIPLYKGTKCLVTYSLKSWVWFRNRQTLNPQLYPSNTGGLHIKHDD